MHPTAFRPGSPARNSGSERVPFITLRPEAGFTSLSSDQNSPSNYLVQMSCSETADSPQIRLLHSFIDGMTKRDVDLVAKTFHKDFRRAVYPRSLNAPEYNKEKWLQELTEIFGVLTEDGKVSHIGCWYILDSPSPLLNPSRSRPSIPS